MMNLDRLSDTDLERMFRNCVSAIVSNKPNAEEARARLEAINAVWQVRLQAAAQGRYKADSPEIGVLKKIGYHVGKDGQPTAGRQALLDHAMSGDLPFTGSPAHMLEWGTPMSATRYRKMHRVIASFATSARTQGDHMSDAGSDWEADLRYIEQMWKVRVGA